MARIQTAPGVLRCFVNNVLHEADDIIHFQYIKKNKKEKGPVFIGIEVKQPPGVEATRARMGAEGFGFKHLNGQPDFLALLVQRCPFASLHRVQNHVQRNARNH